MPQGSVPGGVFGPGQAEEDAEDVSDDAADEAGGGDVPPPLLPLLAVLLAPADA